MEKKPIKVYLPQFDRAEELDYETPKTVEEFYNIINNAPTNILFGYGFRKWSTMNDCIKENTQKKDYPNMISVPAYNMEDLPDLIEGITKDDLPKATRSVVLDCTPEPNRPMQLLDHDEEIWLFPKEWYDLIPEGFQATGLFGQSFPFEKSKTDNDTRFGCLGYGIRKLLTPNSHETK